MLHTCFFMVKLEHKSYKMKNIKKHTSTSKKIILILASILVFALASTGVALLLNNQNIQQKAVETSEESQAIDQQPDNTNTDSGSKEESTNTDKPESPIVNESNTKTVVQMTVSVDISNNTVYIRGGINNATLSNGICYAQLSKPNGEAKRIDTTLLQNPSTTDCKTISLKSSDLTSGTWSVKLHYSSDTTEGVSNETSIEIK